MNSRPFLLLLGLALSAQAYAANVKIDNAWARATVPGQDAGGAFMTLSADADVSLIAVASPVAASAELHKMAMEKDVMSMRRVEQIDLPKGKSVLLAPGGLHLMLFGLKAPLKAGEQIPLTLTLRDAKGKTQKIEVKAEVRELGGGMMHHHHH